MKLAKALSKAMLAKHNSWLVPIYKGKHFRQSQHTAQLFNIVFSTGGLAMAAVGPAKARQIGVIQLSN